MSILGKSVFRKEAFDKVTGKAKYTADEQEIGMLHVQMLTSPYGHALIKQINIESARSVPGVRAIVTGQDSIPLIGEEIQDRYPVAKDRVRYYGEVVALVVADNPIIARHAADLIHVTYEPLSVINSPTEAFMSNTTLLHPQLDAYKKTEGVFPQAHTNIANKTKIRKGDINKGWQESEVIIEETFSLGPSDHAAMETRCATAEIRPDGSVYFTTTSQAPFMLKKLMNTYFQIEVGKVIVKTPLVGGAYGGKASVQWEILAYLASRAVGGRRVKILYSREEDLTTAPCHIGLDATIKLGCKRDGKLMVAELLYLFDGGAYSDKATDLSRAGAVDCTGPYRIDHIWCDAYCMYTNHPYAAPFRGFSHSEVLFAFERAMDMLAMKLKIDPLELRLKNAIAPGDTTPTQVKLNRSKVGNLPACINRLKELMNWEDGSIVRVNDRTIRAKGVSCVWKTSTIDPDASSGVILTFNPDGSINLMSGVVEIGTGTKTILAQMLAERLQMGIDQIHVKMPVHTQTTPEHWKTVASRGTFMAGRALMRAADDAIEQLKSIASIVLRSETDDLTVSGGYVFQKDDPSIRIAVKDIAYGYKYPNGNSIGGQIIARGHYILNHMTTIDPETGKGNPGPEWTVGAQGVEIEFDTRDYTYKVLKAFAVIDIGRVLNEKAALGQVMGSMSMGLAFAGRETFVFDQYARILNPQLRTYRPIHYGENPEYVADFVTTPQADAAYGARGVGEHALLGMPASLGNALTLAAGVNLNELPLVPELIWRKKEGGIQ
ncbi:xanthine dehydrogenase family protein molybdopterin-binding subunit [Priestia koreensis]|uniref:xanthine dehydrogenase family protein molybdopterin-binding subunit n=1 Tax=Priestia koreensis TaxID=284581 RepID=UPI001F5AC924|nr:xanthine dehydrogenase family protein molybdopterin-binding subunit [Priestia koreensis]UNL86300.1 xanthine dehydrogenase family protein molybdopterin-binding subunit [Priestia koreensis]